MEWKPVESAPRDGTEIIVLDNGNPRLAVWSDMLRKFTGSGGNVFNWCDNPTHWQPLPQPPVEQKETE